MRTKRELRVERFSSLGCLSLFAFLTHFNTWSIWSSQISHPARISMQKQTVELSPQSKLLKHEIKCYICNQQKINKSLEDALKIPCWPMCFCGIYLKNTITKKDLDVTNHVCQLPSWNEMQVRTSSSFRILIILPQNSRATRPACSGLTQLSFGINRNIHRTNNCIPTRMLVRITPIIPNQAVWILNSGDLHSIYD